MTEENIKVKKVGESKYGFYLMDEDSQFVSTTKEVIGFLAKKIPCTIEISEKKDIEGKKDVITRVKVLKGESQQNEMEEPIPVENFSQAKNYKPSSTPHTRGNEIQESIVNQFCTREGLRLIEVFNQISEEKIKPTRQNLYSNACIIKEVLAELSKKEEFPDY